MDLHDLRKNYIKNHLSEGDVNENPTEQFVAWFKEAQQSAIKEPNAMTLATATANGKPSARIVLLKEVDEKGFVFFTNYLSRKGSEITANPQAALLFFWDVLERQIRVEGTLKKIAESESENYFNSRPLESRIGAIISKQSCVVKSREALELAFNKAKESSEIKRPQNWGGYLLVPAYFEFWQGGANRIHDRITYTKHQENWLIQRLAP
ncbi:MAG TPA: pyridoxamine 5'-phosphate oxidase [Chitinophagales bacterium]|nr:pyridoxamine 5'-phosphate oxidase [Chitinophagales bacterium]HRP40198.1 pyridoxamine 5'-phosphate oxidase [Chitinophagales bacterium]